jgi:6-phosphogluconolactonase
MTVGRVIVLPYPATLGRRAAEIVTAALSEAVAQRGVAHLCLTGGTTAGFLYEALADGFRDNAAWQSVHLWWGDDRLVPSSHEDSNKLLVERTLLARRGEDGSSVGVRVPVDQIHPFPIDEALSGRHPSIWCAQAYDAELASVMPIDARGVPSFDVLLLGVGADGHILSCFPGSEFVDEPPPGRCHAVPAPTTAAPAVPRVTCSPRVVESARQVLVLAAGAGKAEIVARTLQSRPDPHEIPAVIATHGNAVWLVDEAAGRRLAPA